MKKATLATLIAPLLIGSAGCRNADPADPETDSAIRTYGRYGIEQAYEPAYEDKVPAVPEPKNKIVTESTIHKDGVTGKEMAITKMSKEGSRFFLEFKKANPDRPNSYIISGGIDF